MPGLLSRNWPLKLSALALAVFLWAVVTVLPRTRQSLASVPVRVVLEDTAWTLAGPPTPATVDVLLGGETRDLLQFPRDGEATVVTVPIELVTSQDTVVRLRSDWLRIDQTSGILVENIDPASVRLRFEPTRSAAFPLSLRTAGRLPPDVALAQPLALTPAVVRVRGGAHLIDSLDSVPLEALDLGRVTESGIYRLQVDTTGLGTLSVEPAVATVAARVEAAVEKVVRVEVRFEVGFGTDSLVIVPDTLPVTLRGARTLVDAALPEALVARIPRSAVEGMAPGEERAVPYVVEGVPDLVGVAGAEGVRIRWTGEPGGAGAVTDSPPDASPPRDSLDIGRPALSKGAPRSSPGGRAPPWRGR